MQMYKKIAFIAAMVLLGCDIVSKAVVNRFIPLYELFNLGNDEIIIFEDFLGIAMKIVHVTNKGAAWGILSTFTYLLFAIRIVFVICAVVYMVKRQLSMVKFVSLTMIITGAIGNIIDIIIYGHVIDMFLVILWGYKFPVFNVADSLISIGGTILFFRMFFFE